MRRDYYTYNSSSLVQASAKYGMFELHLEDDEETADIYANLKSMTRTKYDSQKFSNLVPKVF